MPAVSTSQLDSPTVDCSASLGYGDLRGVVPDQSTTSPPSTSSLFSTGDLLTARHNDVIMSDASVRSSLSRDDVAGSRLAGGDSVAMRTEVASASSVEAGELRRLVQNRLEADLSITPTAHSAVSAGSSIAIVPSPETACRAISGEALRPAATTAAQKSVSSPADGERADGKLIAASPTVDRHYTIAPPPPSADADPLATLMRLYGALSDVQPLAPSHAAVITSPEAPQRMRAGSRSTMPSAAAAALRPRQDTATAATAKHSSRDYVIGELNDADDDGNGPPKSYICHVCQYIGTSRSLYLAHMSEHYKHRCTLCGYMTSYAGRLKRHLEDCHSTDEDRPPAAAVQQRKPTMKRCRKCGFESTNLKLFYDHVRTHIRPERVLECPTASCPFVTEYRHHLELHLRNHLNSRPIRCPICPYRCAVSSMLASHLKSHTKVHRFRCAVCRFSSKFSNALKRHLLEKGHARGYVLNPDGSVPEGGAVPFEPGSPSTRQRQKGAAAATAASTNICLTSEAQRKPTRSADVTSEVAIVTGSDVKASIWTPPVAAPSPELFATGNRNPLPSWFTSAGGELKRSPMEMAQMQSPAGPLVPPPLRGIGNGNPRGMSPYACAVCGLDTGGHAELAYHVMTSHFTPPMTSAQTTPNTRRPHKAADRRDDDGRQQQQLPPVDAGRRLTFNDAENSRVTAPAASAQFPSPFRHPPLHAPLPPTAPAWPVFPPVSTPTLRTQLEAPRSSTDDSRHRVLPISDAARFSRDEFRDVHSSSSVRHPACTSSSDRSSYRRDPARQPEQPNYQRLGSSTAAADSVNAAPLDLSRKPLAVDNWQPSIAAAHVSSLLDSAETKRSRRKGKAFKLDAESLNSALNDEFASDALINGQRVAATMFPDFKRGSGSTISHDRAAGWIQRDPLKETDFPRLNAGHYSPSDRQEFSRDRVIDDTGSPSKLRRLDSGDVASRTAGRRTPTSPYDECRHCGLGFRDAELYAMHMDFHGRADPFTCNFCGAATANQVEFFLHVAHAPHNVRPVYVFS